MNFNIFKLIWAIALFSKAAPLGLASGTAKLIAKENQENQVKNMEESKADIEQARTEILNAPSHCNIEKEACFKLKFKPNPKCGGIR